jgi:hypothetical protein
MYVAAQSAAGPARSVLPFALVLPLSWAAGPVALVHGRPASLIAWPRFPVPARGSCFSEHTLFSHISLVVKFGYYPHIFMMALSKGIHALSSYAHFP